VILCAGLSPAWQETLFFDELRIGEVNRAREVHWVASGKVVNAARAAASLARGRGSAVSARAITVLGGESGDAAERSLRAEGLDLVVVRSAAQTRVCNTVINRADGTITELVENAGALTSEELAAFRAHFLREVEGARAVILTGSLSAGAPADFYHGLLAKVSVPVILDARGPELVEALKLRPFLVKPNREELSKTVGRPIAGEADLRAAMLDMARRGARWVLVSQGRDAVWAHGEGKFWRFRPPRVQTQNPIGSGDCLAAGIAHAIVEGAEVLEAIRLGIASGAENASTRLPAFIERAAVERRLAEVTVEPA
jgi:1-phosphofructokinase family hexose kinase